jgi:hypothetical protein
MFQQTVGAYGIPDWIIHQTVEMTSLPMPVSGPYLSNNTLLDWYFDDLTEFTKTIIIDFVWDTNRTIPLVDQYRATSNKYPHFRILDIKLAGSSSHHRYNRASLQRASTGMADKKSQVRRMLPGFPGHR